MGSNSGVQVTPGITLLPMTSALTVRILRKLWYAPLMINDVNSESPTSSYDSDTLLMHQQDNTVLWERSAIGKANKTEL